MEVHWKPLRVVFRTAVEKRQKVKVSRLIIIISVAYVILKVCVCVCVCGCMHVWGSPTMNANGRRATGWSCETAPVGHWHRRRWAVNWGEGPAFFSRKVPKSWTCDQSVFFTLAFSKTKLSNVKEYVIEEKDSIREYKRWYGVTFRVRNVQSTASNSSKSLLNLFVMMACVTYTVTKSEKGTKMPVWLNHSRVWRLWVLTMLHLDQF